MSESSPKTIVTESDIDDALLAEVARLESVDASMLAGVGLAEAPSGRADAQRAELQPGDQLDHFRVVRALGRGGMGIVYAAENLRTHKPVALKIMALGSRLSPERVANVAARFHREARAAASIRHPNVVDVYDVGGSEDAPYLVMELLEGESLRARLSRGPLPWPEARSIMLSVLSGVGAAHGVGIVHRDLKPDNVMLARVPSSDQPVPIVLDFGIASVSQTADDGQSLTRTGTLLGTPAYMAPEQLAAGEVDARSDVYALGVMLYELLCAALPFTARSASALAVLQATSKPVPLSQQRGELRGAVEAVVMRALARRPTDRYESAQAFASAIAGVGHGRRGAHARWWALVLGVGLLLALACVWFTRTRTPQQELPRSPVTSAEYTPPPAPLGELHDEKVEAARPVAAEVVAPEVVAPASRAKQKRARETARPRARTREPIDLALDEF